MLERLDRLGILSRLDRIGWDVMRVDWIFLDGLEQIGEDRIAMIDKIRLNQTRVDWIRQIGRQREKEREIHRYDSLPCIYIYIHTYVCIYIYT